MRKISITRAVRAPVALVACVALVISLVGTTRADRPYAFGMGHYLAAWAGQPWSYDSDAMDRMNEMGATAVWVDFPWSAMEATEGVYDWSYADHQVDTAEAHGLEMFAYVGTTPSWAKLHPELPSHRTPPSEDHVDEFATFHTTLADRYAGRVKYFQFWNEPSGCSWINDGCSNGGDCSLFTIWQQRAYDALKAGNPDCVVSTGGFDGWAPGYLQCMYDQGGGLAFDAVSIHPYAGGGSGGPGTGGEAIWYDMVIGTREVMVNNGDAGKKIWITEYGWNTTDETQRSEDLIEVLTELTKLEYHYVFYNKHLVLNDWTDFCCYGLTDPWFNPKPAFYAFRDFDKTFDDAVDFTTNITTGVPPLEVQFYEMSDVADESSWEWDFGDGQTSHELNPLHSYAEDGIYTVRLTVTGTNGAVFEEKTDYITVGRPEGIFNPSFEDPIDFLNGWSSCLSSGTTIKHNPGSYVPAPPFHDGDNSAGISSGRTGDDAGEGAIYQEIAVIPGHTYRVRCWGMITAGDGYHADDFMQLRIRDGDSAPLSCVSDGAGIVDNSDLYAHLQAEPPVPAWTALEGTILTTNDVITIIAYWDFNGPDWTINALHLDDWSIEDITPPTSADMDGDDDVDLDDFGVFQTCITGPNLGPVQEGCESVDFDHDNDIDQSDFGAFQQCYSGPDIPADPDCVN